MPILFLLHQPSAENRSIVLSRVGLSERAGIMMFSITTEMSGKKSRLTSTFYSRTHSFFVRPADGLYFFNRLFF
jgi:hypothetical protein